MILQALQPAQLSMSSSLRSFQKPKLSAAPANRWTVGKDKIVRGIEVLRNIIEYKEIKRFEFLRFQMQTIPDRN